MSNSIETYDAQADFDFASTMLASTMLSLGYKKEQFDSITFDEVIQKIRYLYAYRQSKLIDGYVENYAGLEYLKSLNIVLTRVLRRSYFDTQIARYELNND